MYSLGRWVDNGERMRMIKHGTRSPFCKKKWKHCLLIWVGAVGTDATWET